MEKNTTAQNDPNIEIHVGNLVHHPSVYLFNSVVIIYKQKSEKSVMFIVHLSSLAFFCYSKIAKFPNRNVDFGSQCIEGLLVI